MVKIIAILAGGAVLGASAMWMLTAGDGRELPAAEVVRDIGEAPKMALEIAEAHRDGGFVELTSIAEVIALPDSFTRAEALHALAGRTSLEGVRDLIFEANRIADDYEREQTLFVLFHRMAMQDPGAAVALAQSEYFLDLRMLEVIVWEVWSRHNLTEALAAAGRQPGRAQRNAAAQALYSAWGLRGNATTDRIERELGIGPDRSTRARYMHRLADESVIDAIAFIESLGTTGEQNENISWLATYLSLRDTAEAMEYAELFTEPSNAQRYRSIVQGKVARENPRATLDRIIAEGPSRSRRNEFYSAVRELVRTDMDGAKAYFDSLSNPQYKQALGSHIAQEMVRSDPAAALAWARAADVGPRSYIELNVLHHIAAKNPQLALEEALSIKNADRRQSAISNVFSQLGQSDPEAAVAYIDQMPAGADRRRAMTQISQGWMMQDPEAALDWLQTQDGEMASRVLAESSYSLMHSDIDAAIRLLPRLDEQQQQQWRTQIVHQLAQAHSLDDAQAFVARFENEPGYEQLQANLINGLVNQDVAAARQLADQLNSSTARDSAYIQIIGAKARTDPVEAMSWLDNIVDEGMRSAAAAQAAGQWYSSDPQAAQAWVSELPAGSMRDDAVLNMSHHWVQGSYEQLELIASISDQEKRAQAKVNQIYRLMRSDPAQARELLEDEDIPDHLRQQVELNLAQSGLLAR